MNKVIIFAAGGSLGFLAGWFVSKKFYEEEMNNKIEAEISDMRDYFKEKEAEIVKKVNKDLEDESEEMLKTHYEKPSLDELRNRYASTDEVEEYKEENMANYISPKIIPMDEYGEDDTYQSQELLYYQDNDTLLDEMETVIEDPGRIIGTALTKYNFDTNDETDIFVVNENLETYYHIHKIFSSWEG